MKDQSMLNAQKFCYNAIMPTIGLTGNFGMGKSTVLRIFDGLGARVFNIDDFVHSILEREVIIKKVVSILGETVLSGRPDKLSLNRKRVAKIIFDDPDKRNNLEKIIHPEVLKVLKSTEAGILRKDPGSVIVYEIPLLFEAGYEVHFDKVVVVYSSTERALKRLAVKGYSREEALSRMRAQMPVSAKLELADYSINNNYSLERTEKRVKKIMDEIKKIGDGL